MLRKLAKCIREYKLATVLTLLFIVLEAIIETFIPFITANLVNHIKDGADIQYIYKTGGVLVLLACASLASGGIAGLTCARASAGFAKNLRHDIFAKIQTYSFENIDKFSSASLVTRLTTDVSSVQMAFMMLIRTAIRSPLMLIFSVVMAYIMGGALAASFVIVIPVLGVGLYWIGKKAMPAFRHVFKKYDKLNESIEENVRGMRVVKGFSRETYEKEKFNAASDDIRKDFTRAERIVSCNAPLMNFAMYFNTSFVLFIGAMLIVKSGGTTVDIGQMSAMLTYGVQILMSLMMLSMIYVMLTMSTEAAKRIVEVLDETPNLQNPENPVMEISDGSVSFENVSFKYAAKAKRYALSDINLKIESGQTIGIIGGTGSGKSTLVQLISRLYDVTEGKVLVGGRDVREYDLETLRDAVAMVLQKNLLFSGTIRENLLWGNPGATQAEIEAACRIAQADEFIRKFPDGYKTKIEQGGTNVSGGQKQRLCIARAILKAPKILILDDSTSAVDTKTDALLRRGLKETLRDTTKIIIAQRISSVLDADNILVLDNGKISACGTHEELLSECDIYRGIYLQQTNEGGGEDDKNE